MATIDTSPTRRWVARLLVISLSVLLHGALLVWLFSTRMGHSLPPQADAIAVDMVILPEPEPEPKPEAEPEPELEPELEPEPEPEPAPIPQPRPPERQPVAAQPAKPASGPPVHTFGDNQEWAAPPAVQHSSAPVRSRPVAAAYAETVKGKVTANLKRPEGAVYKPPPGYRGDPNDFKRQCYIPYEITVDSAGQVLGYEIDRCGDELLDAAAEQAVRSAGPFPPPPNQGADSYVIYGTAIFIN